MERLAVHFIRQGPAATCPILKERRVRETPNDRYLRPKALVEILSRRLRNSHADPPGL